MKSPSVITLAKRALLLGFIFILIRSLKPQSSPARPEVSLGSLRDVTTQCEPNIVLIFGLVDQKGDSPYEKKQKFLLEKLKLLLLSLQKYSNIQLHILTNDSGRRSIKHLRHLMPQHRHSVRIADIERIKAQVKQLKITWPEEGGHLWEMPKLFIHEEFSDLDSAIFIDIDAVVLGELSMACSELNRLKAEQKFVAYVPELSQDEMWTNHANTGMMLMNLRLMREENLWEKLVDSRFRFSEKHPECKFWPPDQGVWNAWFSLNQEKIIILEHAFHFNCINFDLVKSEDIFVLHYCGMSWLGDTKYKRPQIEEKLQFLLNQTHCTNYICSD